MEFTRLLRLDRQDSKGRVSIHFRICWAGEKVRLSSGEKILPADWDDKKNQVRSKAQFSADINGRLAEYESGISKFFNKTEGAITPDMVRLEIERIRQSLGKKPKRNSIIINPKPVSLITPTEFVTQYIQERRADRSESWRESMKIVGDHLSAFRPGINWQDLRLSTLNLFKVYLQDELELSDNTLETYVALLNGMLKYAVRSGLPVLPDYQWLEVRRAGEPLQPELTLKEIKQLQAVELDQTKEDLEFLGETRIPDLFEQTRWYFLMACNTGLRHSDLWQLVNPKIVTMDGYHCLEVYQQKTKRRVPIPLDDDIYQLIQNPVNRNRPAVRAWYNHTLKPIGQQAELNRIVTVGSHYGGRLHSEELPLHKTMSSHMARRTFATLMTEGGMSTRTLQEIMGHASISSTQKYAKVSNESILSQTITARRKILTTL